MSPIEFKEHKKTLTGRPPSKGFKAVSSKGENTYRGVTTTGENTFRFCIFISGQHSMPNKYLRACHYVNKII